MSLAKIACDGIELKKEAVQSSSDCYSRPAIIVLLYIRELVATLKYVQSMMLSSVLVLATAGQSLMQRRKCLPPVHHFLST